MYRKLLPSNQFWTLAMKIAHLEQVWRNVSQSITLITNQSIVDFLLIITLIVNMISLQKMPKLNCFSYLPNEYCGFRSSYFKKREEKLNIFIPIENPVNAFSIGSAASGQSQENFRMSRKETAGPDLIIWLFLSTFRWQNRIDEIEIFGTLEIKCHGEVFEG